MEAKQKQPTLKSQVAIRVAICLGVLLAGLVGMTSLASLKQPPAEAKVAERALRVEIAEMAARDVPVTITAYGEVAALNTVAISSEVAGRVTGVHPRLEVGEIVAEGEMLFHIDPRDYQAACAESAATVAELETAILRLEKQQEIDTQRLKTLERNRELAKAEFERLQTLFSVHQVGTRSGVDQAEQAYNAAVDQVDQMAQTIALYPIRIREQTSSLAAARARLTKARTNLERCTVRAPFSGRITAVAVEAGQYVAPGQIVVTLADDSMLEIQLPLDSRDARKWLQFDKNAEANGNGWISGLKPVECQILWTEDKTGSGWTGRLHRAVEFDPQTRTLTVAVRIDARLAAGSTGGGLPLVEGMFCEVRIPGKTLENVYRVPRKAVNMDKTVYVAKDSRLHTVPVTVARFQGDSALIGQGLFDGDQVIITRLVDPLENALLKITNE